MRLFAYVQIVEKSLINLLTVELAPVLPHKNTRKLYYA